MVCNNDFEKRKETIKKNNDEWWASYVDKSAFSNAFYSFCFSDILLLTMPGALLKQTHDVYWYSNQRYAYNMWNSSTGVNDACITANGEGEEWKCIFAQYVG